MIKLNPEQLLSLTGLDLPFPDTIPFPDDGDNDLGDIFHLAGTYRYFADLCNPTNNWAFLPPPKKLARYSWKSKKTLRRQSS